MMLNDNKGQMRIVEAMITCIILVSGLSISIYMSSVYTGLESSNVEKAATDVLNVLDNVHVIERVVNNQSSWKPELKGLIESLLPTDTFYELDLRSASTGELLGEITNLAESDSSSIMDFLAVKRVVTLSFPLSKTEYKPIDVVLVIDISGSMNDKLPGDRYTKIYAAKEAAKLFVDQLSASEDRVGIVTFSTEATLKMHLTSNFAAAKSTIDALSANGWTNIGDGICKAADEFTANGRIDGTVWVMVLLSDGKTNTYFGQYNPTLSRQYALQQAQRAADMGIRTYTIGLGAKTDIDEALLMEITANGGQYYYAPSAEDLADIYTKIAGDLMFSVKYDMIILELTIMKPR